MELADGIAGPGSGQYLHGSEPRFHGDGFGSFLAERDAGREHRAGHTLLATGSRATGAGGLHHNRFGDAHGTRRASGVPRDADRHQHIRDSERGAVDFRVCFLHGLLGAVSDRIGGRQSTLKLGSNGQPAAFTVVARTTSGGQWLSVTPSSGTAPATLTVTASLTGLGSGIYCGDLAIQGPGNTLHVMVNLTIFPLPGPPAPSGLATSPEVLVFYLPAGAAAPASSATDLRAAGGRLRSGFGANGNRHGVAWRRGDCQRAQPGRRGSKCQCGQHGAGHLYRERSSFPRPH